jgi:nitroreductase
MDFLKLVKERKSIRKYEPLSIEEDTLRYILDAGRFAPSAKNSQGWKFVVVREKENRQKLAASYPAEWLASAPAIVVICMEKGHTYERCDGKDYLWADAAISIDHMVLAAAEQGVGSCWIGAFDPKVAAEAIGLSLVDYEIIALLPLGYPAEKGRDKFRRSFEEVVSFEKFSF